MMRLTKSRNRIMRLTKSRNRIMRLIKSRNRLLRIIRKIDKMIVNRKMMLMNRDRVFNQWITNKLLIKSVILRKQLRIQIG